MSSELPHDPRFRTFHRAFVGRVPGPIGCLAALLLCTVGIVVGLVAFVVSLIPWPRRRRAATAAAATGAARAATPGSREAALRRLVRAMAMDATFTSDDARQAGTLASGGATIDELLGEAVDRRWIELRPGGVYAVTDRGRAESEREA